MCPDKEKARMLEIFISYAHEDERLALAVVKCFGEALGDFANIFFDKLSLEFGFEFKPQIEEKLDSTDILIIIYTGKEKPSHSYTGWEVGYFRSVQRRGNTGASFERRIVPLYLEEMPAPTVGLEGIPLGITRATLTKNENEFTSSLEVNKDDPMVKFLDELQDILDKIKEQGGFPKSLRRPDTVECVRKMRIEIFQYLKTTIEKKFKPQKQIVIKTKQSSLDSTDGELPGDAQLIPTGSGSPMSVFGLSEVAISWNNFIVQVSEHKFGDCWRDAINSVVSSAVSNQIDVDNSQMILSNDGLHEYRLILTSSTTYYNGSKEFKLYLVEALRPKDFGDGQTTTLLKGLEMVCRYRFMFLESSSEFFCKNILALSTDRIPSLARSMIRELNLLRKAAREAGLDQPNIWSQYVDWDNVTQMSQTWMPIEKNIRQLAASIESKKSNLSNLADLQKELANVLENLERDTREQNRLLIEQMSEKLRSFVGVANNR